MRHGDPAWLLVMLLLVWSAGLNAASGLPERLQALEADLRELRVGSAPSPIGPSWRHSCRLPPSSQEALARSLRERARATRQDPALDLEVGLGEDLAGNSSDSDAFVGVSWNLLDAGRAGLRRRARILELEADITRVAGDLARRDQFQACRLQRLAQPFAALEGQLRSRRVQLLESLRQATRRAYLDGRVLLERLLTVESELAAQRALQPATEPPMPAALELPPVPLPDFPQLTETLRRDGLRTRALALEQTALRARHQARHERQRLRLFARYQLDAEDSSESGFAFGLRYRRALFRSRSDGLGERLEAARLADEHETRRRIEALEQDRHAFQRAQSRLREANFAHLEAVERLRRANLEWQLDPSPTALAEAAQRGQNALAQAMTLVTALDETHQTVARALSRAGVTEPGAYLQFENLTGADYRARAGERAMYVWSATYRRLGPRLLGDLAAARSIGHLLISTGSDAPLDPPLGSGTRADGLRITRLIGVNSWVLPGGQAAALERLADLELPPGGLHLDIEPHTLPEYDLDPGALLQSYLRLVAAVRGALPPETPLGVSVPLIWPLPTYQALGRHVDSVYLMAYGSANTATLARRLDPVLAQLTGVRPVLALRPSDFASPAALEEAYLRLRSELPLAGLAIHDAAALLGAPPPAAP